MAGDGMESSDSSSTAAAVDAGFPSIHMLPFLLLLPFDDFEDSAFDDFDILDALKTFEECHFVFLPFPRRGMSLLLRRILEACCDCCCAVERFGKMRRRSVSLASWGSGNRDFQRKEQ